jgi:hypothetical protein
LIKIASPPILMRPYYFIIFFHLPLLSVLFGGASAVALPIPDALRLMLLVLGAVP